MKQLGHLCLPAQGRGSGGLNGGAGGGDRKGERTWGEHCRGTGLVASKDHFLLSLVALRADHTPLGRSSLQLLLPC